MDTLAVNIDAVVPLIVEGGIGEEIKTPVFDIVEVLPGLVVSGGIVDLASAKSDIVESEGGDTDDAGTNVDDIVLNMSGTDVVTGSSFSARFI